MVLNVRERIVLLRTLPREGKLVTLKIVRKLRESLSFTEEEHKRLKFFEKDGMTHWDPSEDFEREFEFSDVACDVVKEVLKRLEEAGHLKEDQLSLYEKFCGS